MVDTTDDFPHVNGTVTEKEIREIGAVIYNWNVIELLLEALVAKMLGIEFNTATTIMNSTSAKMQHDTVLAILAEKAAGHPALAEAESCVKRYLDLSNFRNDVAHGRWWENGWATEGAFVALQKKGSASDTRLNGFYQKSAEVRKLNSRLRSVLSEFWTP